MPRLKPVTKDQANAKAKPFLEAVEKKLGTIPNLMKTMANAPAVLEAYLGFSGTLAKGTLSPKLREQIALVVGESNRCDYCLAAHSALGRMAGLSDEEITDSRRGSSPDRKTESVLGFARTLVAERGRVSDEDVAKVRAAGFDDGGIAEIVANVSLNIFTNYFNHVADADVDFPEVKPVQSPSCAC